LTLKRDTANCIQYCVPNPGALSLRTCRYLSGNCTGDKESIYFGFDTICGTTGADPETCSVPDLIFSNETLTTGIDAGDKIIRFVETSMPEDNLGSHYYHCMSCEYGVNFEESLYPYTVVCKEPH
jgi:hypothetical protein